MKRRNEKMNRLLLKVCLIVVGFIIWSVFGLAVFLRIDHLDTLMSFAFGLYISIIADLAIRALGRKE
jgi:biotin transporter BioY